MQPQFKVDFTLKIWGNYVPGSLLLGNLFWLSFLPESSIKTVIVYLTYEETQKFCVFAIFSFNFDEILWCDHEWNNSNNNNNNNNNNNSLSLLLKTKMCSTLTILLCVFWDQYCVGSTEEKPVSLFYCGLSP